MARYVLASDFTMTSGAPPVTLAAVTPGASVGVALTGAMIGIPDSGTAAGRFRIKRATGGTSTPATASALNSREAAAGAAGATNYTVEPAITGSPLVLLPAAVTAALVHVRRWLAPNPRYPIYSEPSGDSLAIETSFNGTTQNDTVLSFAEPYPEQYAFGRFRGRRSTSAGYIHISDASRSIAGVSTAPKHATSGWAYIGVQTLDWPTTASSSMQTFLNLLNAVAGGDHPLNADPGTYALAGADAGLLATRLLPATAGSYVLSGASADVLAGHVVGAAAGAYGLSGVDASLRLTNATLGAAAGAYTVTGATAALLAARLLGAGVGAYSVTGADASLMAGRVLAASAGAYVLSGANAQLLRAALLLGAAGSYTITGVAADLARGGGIVAYTLNADPGVYVLTGAAARAVLDLNLFPVTGAPFIVIIND